VTGYILKIKRLLTSGEEQTKKMYVLPFRDTQDAAEIKKIITIPAKAGIWLPFVHNA
jgi:hypothetical protein